MLVYQGLDDGLPGGGCRFTGYWVTVYRVKGAGLPGNG